MTRRLKQSQRRGCRCALLLSLGLLTGAMAQRTDPMMQLMLSQPPVDLSSPVVVTAVVDPPVVPVGELAVYRITLNALEASVRWPRDLAVPTGLTLKPSAGGQMLPLIAGTQRPITARNFHIRAARPGFYTLRAFEIEAYGNRVIVPETQLEVSAGPRPGYEPARRIYLQAAKTNAFVGETIPVSLVVPGNISNVVSGLGQIQFNGDGVHGTKAPNRQLVEPREVGGRQVATMIYETSITPIAAGPIELSVQAFTTGMLFTGPVELRGQLSIQGFSADNVLLDSEPVNLTVNALPTIGDVQGFTGFIGTVAVDPPSTSSDKLRVGDALRLLVTFRGEPAVSRLIPPTPPPVEGWQIYPAAAAEPPAGTPATNTVVAFAYTLIPTTEEVKSTPAIPFHVFDPQRANYVNLTIPSVPVKVSAEGLPTNWLAEIVALEEESPVDRRPRLNELSPVRGSVSANLQPLQSNWQFVLLQLAPVTALFGWWGFERRRRFLEAHPEIVRRRRALRALRRERKALRRAVADRDSAGFSTTAVTALQIAAAPHFPAEPRAIVCQEVLGLLSEGDQRSQKGEVIRSLFARQNAVAFSANRGDGPSMFGVKTELDGILDELEARL